MESPMLSSMIEKALREATDALEHAPWSAAPILHSMATYSLSGAAKRIRPRLLLGLVLDQNHQGAESIQPVHLVSAVALEVLHCATLVHDDLPGLDDDDERRGRPTVHKQYGVGEAVLLGDFLLPFALSLILEDARIQPSEACEACRVLSAAFKEVMLGQLLDQRVAQSSQVEASLLPIVHRYKTAAFFRAAAELSCVLLPPDSTARLEMRQAGELLGRHFQLVDDFLDREDDAPNIFHHASLIDAMSRLDASLQSVLAQLMKIEGLNLGKTMLQTRRLLDEIESQYREGSAGSPSSNR